MTKKDLIKVLDEYSDDVEIYIAPFHNMYNTDAPATLVRMAEQVKYIDDGNGGVKDIVMNIQNGITIINQ